MRTTLDLNDALLIRAKEMAARERTTLTRIIEEGLAIRLRQEEPAAELAALPALKIFRPPPGSPTIDAETIARRIDDEEVEYFRRMAGLDPFPDPDDE